VRESQNRANVIASEARQVARNAIVAMWEAEERALRAESEAAAAVARAEDAEEQLRQLKSQMKPVSQPAGGGVDRWLNEAYQQLRLASEKRSDPTPP